MSVGIMSLKFDIEEYPEFWSKELVTALEDYKNGKRNSKRNLHKFVNHEISEYYYNELIKRYAFSYRINKEKRDRETSQKIKDVLFGVAAFIVLIGSMASTLGDVVVHYGKGTAAWYFILWLWAVNYVVSIDSKKIRELKQENEKLKDKIASYDNNERENQLMNAHSDTNNTSESEE